MGCSLSKDAESPSRGSKGTSSWEKVIHRRFSIQINRSLKTTDGGYIAAIFSANYGILRRHAPIKALDKKASLQNPVQKESYPTHKRSMAVKLDANAHNNSTVDAVVGLPLLNTQSASKLVEAHKLPKRMKENLESIDILELMEGLAEDEVSASWQASHESSFRALLKRESSTVISSKSTYKEHISEALSANKIARRPRPKSLSSISSIRSIEDVDLALSRRRGKAPPPLNCAREAWQRERDVNVERFLPSKERDINVEMFLPSEKIADKISDDGIKPQDNNIDISILPACRFPTSVEDASMQNLENLQRALSFKYIFNHSSSEKQNLLDLDALPPQVNKGNSTICRSESLVFATARVLCEGDGNSSPSSPEFPAAGSLKDWLPSSSHLSKPQDNSICGYDTSISETLQFFESQTWEAEQSHHTSVRKTVESFGTKRVSNQCLSLDPQDELEIEECAVPVFDPEMVDTFENAMRHLSKEEWYAVRGMEDSPRNFLRLVKALKKSSSNSARDPKERFANSKINDMKAHNTAGMDTMDSLEPGKSVESKPTKLSTEKKQTFMRQNSLGIAKGFSSVRASDDTHRARVVFYSSTRQVDSKAHEDCSRVRSILQSLVGICYDERSISEFEENEQELRHALNISVAIVPTIYVKGKYLVGIESISHLYEKGMLGSILKDAVAFESSKTYHAMHLQREQDSCLPTLQGCVPA